jgi:hypothetical protein
VVRFARACLFVAALGALATLPGCGCLRSTVNASSSLRWTLFASFGASRVCPEMQKRGVPIRLEALGPASVGRFFPQDCRVTVNHASRTLSLVFGGSGYASLPAVRRVGFAASVGVELRPDFRLESDATYVWGRFDHLLFPPDVRILGVENTLANAAATQTPLGSAATVLSQSIVASELAKGFTVVQREDGDDFALGILTPPELPARPFQPGKKRVMLASEVVAVAASARAFLGPFELGSNGASLYFRGRVDGAPLVYGVFDRAVGDAFETAQPLAAPPAPPILSGVVGPGAGELQLPLARGSYYVVLENRSTPPSAPFGLPLPMSEPIAYVTYAAEVGDRR